MSVNSSADERRMKLRELIRNQGFASLNDLRDRLGVSESTIRRDLDHLEETGEARRTHGGVFCTGPTASLRMFEDRLAAQWDRKRQIAIAASQLIEDHATILLDGGSTTYELARQLVGRPLQVVTNSLPVANLFASSEGVDLILLGGYVHSRTGVSLGTYANEMLSSLNVQFAMLSVSGIDLRGYYNSNLLLVETERTMMQAADHTVICADSSKFGRSSLSRLCKLSDVEHVVSDSSLPESWQTALTQAGVKLTLGVPSSEPTDSEIAADNNVATT